MSIIAHASGKINIFCALSEKKKCQPFYALPPHNYAERDEFYAKKEFILP